VFERPILWIVNNYGGHNFGNLCFNAHDVVWDFWSYLNLVLHKHQFWSNFNIYIYLWLSYFIFIYISHFLNYLTFCDINPQGGNITFKCKVFLGHVLNNTLMQHVMLLIEICHVEMIFYFFIFFITLSSNHLFGKPMGVW